MSERAPTLVRSSASIFRADSVPAQARSVAVAARGAIYDADRLTAGGMRNTLRVIMIDLKEDAVTDKDHQTSYRDLVRATLPPKPAPCPTPEEDLDNLLADLAESPEDGPTHLLKSDPIQALRETTINVLIPVFVELVEKYSNSGISLQMDASNFLEGGREIRFQFGMGQYRIDLHGTVTTEAIAFHETRHNPEVHGELVSGPMLRIRGLDGNTFRDFVCERMASLIRSAMRRH